jgi:antitoxin component YwqK of YwqJK toxin-antitoxin module
MSFLVVDKVMLSCSYGTCSSKLKVTPLHLPPMSFGISPPSLGLGLAAGIGAGLKGKLGAGLGAGAGLEGKLGEDLTVPNGLVQTFDAEGQVISQAHFEAGIMAGESLAFDAEGRVTQRLMFVGGKLHGKASMYAEGVLTAGMNFEQGLMQGESKFYDMQGRLAIQTNFAGGLEDGMRMTFDVETGALLKSELFVQGVMSGAAEAEFGAGFGVSLPELPEVSLDVDMDAGALGTIGGKIIGTIKDHLPHVNIRPFCYCKSLANPAVAAATKKAKGKLTPQPCTPKTHAPWIPGSQDATMLGHPTLTDTSKLLCVYAGIIHVKEAGQNKASVP